MSILYAYIDNNRTNRLHIDDYDKTEHKGRVYCAHGHPVVGKKGTKQIWHYAHKSGYDYDCSRKMGRWHRWWQDRMIGDFLEIIIDKEYPEGSGQVTRHIADAINGDDLVVEFQKSVVPPNVIHEREEFYNNMIWVFYCGEHRIEILAQRGRYIRAKLMSGSRFFLEAQKRSFLDFDMRGVLEMLRIEKHRSSHPELYLRIWTQQEFDEEFMDDCLRQKVDRRHHRKPYKFEDLGEKFEEALKFLRKS